MSKWAYLSSLGSITYGSFQLSSDSSCIFGNGDQERAYPSPGNHQNPGSACRTLRTGQGFGTHDRLSQHDVHSQPDSKATGFRFSNLRPCQAPSRVAVLLASKIPVDLRVSLIRPFAVQHRPCSRKSLGSPAYSNMHATMCIPRREGCLIRYWLAPLPGF